MIFFLSSYTAYLSYQTIQWGVYGRSLKMKDVDVLF